MTKRLKMTDRTPIIDTFWSIAIFFFKTKMRDSKIQAIVTKMQVSSPNIIKIYTLFVIGIVLSTTAFIKIKIKSVS